MVAPVMHKMVTINKSKAPYNCLLGTAENHPTTERFGYKISVKGHDINDAELIRL